MKRLSEHQQRYGDEYNRQREVVNRRRASSNVPLMSPLSGRSRQGSTNVGDQQSSIRPSPPSISPPSAPSITNRPLPRPPSIDTYRNRRSSREITLPKWQPDVEVTKCPICEITFSFWYRKHHCRKCGRVVCANCSPHRITIPRQFIVHPPEEAASSPTTTENTGVVDLTGDNHSHDISSNPIERPQSSDYKIDPALGGGQEVRLCNPCVPDPNPLPHLPQLSSSNSNSLESFPRPDRSVSHNYTASWPNFPAPVDGRPHVPARTTPLRRLSSHYVHLPNLDGSLLSRETFDYPESDTPLSQRAREANGATNPLMPPPGYSSMYGSAPNQNQRQRELAALIHQSRASHRHHRQNASMGHLPSMPRHGPIPSFNSPMHPPPPRAPRPQLREEDECPICHQALPPKGPDNSEVAREAHVQSCIETHFSTSAPRPSNPPPSAAPGAAVAASASTPSQAAGPRPVGSCSSAHRASVTSADLPSPSSSSAPRKRPTGMLTYQASEKDCVGADGEGTQECVICFEEFAVGDEMGRLECLCKFHKFGLEVGKEG
ncbi:hypothetical protein ACLMJK_008409 [Lecanora helva]